MRWVEKYRPKIWAELVGQSDAAAILQRVLVRRDALPHLLFIGPPGSGKTSAALLVGESLKLPVVELNASDERGIDVVRGKVKSLSESKAPTILLLDECDNMTDDAQQAMRRIMERTHYTLFILCGNSEWRIIEPIVSRCVTVRFAALKDEDVLLRLLDIASAEGVPVTSESRPGFLAVVSQARGDLRKAINTMEGLFDKDGKIDAAEVAKLAKPSVVAEAVKLAVAGNFEDARKMLEDGYILSNSNTNEVLTELYAAVTANVPGDARLWLYAKLADLEHNLRHGGTPVIQLVGFIAYVWLAPHLSVCPTLRGATIGG